MGDVEALAVPRVVVDQILACLPMSDDGTGHVADCGYDDETMTCGCYTLPERLAEILAAHVAAARAEERERWAEAVRGILHDLRRYVPDGDLFDEANPRHVSVGLIAVRLRGLLPEDLRPREGA